jgi:hypothetical protein
MADLQSVHVLDITVKLHDHFLTAVKAADVGSFADTGHKTALYGSSTDDQNLPFLAEPKTIRITAEVSSFMKSSV